MLTNENIIFYIIAYLVGAIPFGLLLVKAFAKTDLRQEGSKSIGATNVLRVLKSHKPQLAKKLALATMILDALKGLLVIVVAYKLGLSYQSLWTIGVLAVIGHCFSPYLGFEGGKGVATAIGVVSFFLPLEALIALIIWLVAGKFIRISSISSLSAVTGFLIATYVIDFNMPHINTHAPIWIICVIIFYKHIPNILRLFLHQENKVI